MAETKKFTFRIKHISTLEFSIKNISNDETFLNDNFSFDIAPQLFIGSDKTIGFNTIINVFSKGNPDLVCTLHTQIIFEIINFEDFIDPNNSNSLSIPDQLIQTLLSITISTSRGILSAKTEGTILKNAYLPVLNPTGFKIAGTNIQINNP